MQHQDPIQNYLPVHTSEEAYDSDYLPGVGIPPHAVDAGYIKEESQFRELLNLLYAGRWFILGAFLLVLTATAVYTYTRVPVYRAHSLVLLDSRLAPDLKDALDAGPNSRGSASRSVDTEIYVLQQSLSVFQRVSARLLELEKDPETGKPLSFLAYGLDVDGLATMIQSQIFIMREPVEDVLRISAASVNPSEARLLADMYAEEFVGQALGRSRSRLAATRFFLENEADERNRELKALEEEMRRFMGRNNGLSLGEGTVNLVAQVTELESLRDEIQLDIEMQIVLRNDLLDELKIMQPRLAQQVTSNVPAQIERKQEAVIAIEDKLDQIYKQNPGLKGSVEAANDETIQGHQDDLARLQSELAGLTDQYIQQIMVFGEEAVGSAEGSTRAFGRLRRQLAEAELEIARLRARKDVVAGHLATFHAQLEGLPEQTIALTQLKRSISTTERAYLLLTEKLEDVRISEESEQGYAEIVRKAEMPFYPEFPNKPKNLILGGLVGLLVGLALAVGRQQWYKDTVETPDDVQRLGFQLLGIVPSMRAYIREKYRGVKLVEHNGYLNDSCLISLQEPTSFVVDAYRRLRFGIQGTHGANALQTILVTSPNPGEGKSTTALNLAITSALAGQRTVVIDTDLRRPSIHTKLGIENEPGFTDMFAQRRLQFRRALTHIENLYVLTAGESIDSSGEILSSKEMIQLIAELKRLFDVVILDSPPFMLVSDSLILSAMCDATVIVAAAGRTKSDDLQQGTQELQKVGGRVLGIVLNEFEPVGLPSSRTKYKYYSYTNHYSYQDKTDALLQS